ncbi:MAG: BMP family ABC transporter substrate-binding protein [Actinomycetes bacterium]
MLKRITATAAAIAIATLGFVAPAQAAAKPDCSNAKFKVGVVTDLGKVDDKSFNQSAWDGAKIGAKSVAGGCATYVETTDSKDYAKNMALFGDANYDVIVTVGYLMQDASALAAAKYPKIKFIGVDQNNSSTNENLTGLIFDEDKSGFLAGYLAGYLTKSNKVGGVLAAKEVPPVYRFGQGYINGVAYAAKEQKKTIKTSVVYHEVGATMFGDPAWGATTAGQLLGQGYDVIFGAGGGTGNGALVKVAKKKGAFCIGVDTDQWFTVPEAQPCLVTSAMKSLSSGVSDLIGLASNGYSTGGEYKGDAAIAPYHALASRVPAAVQAKVKALTPKVLDGTVPTGVK